jgi:hypothetical protein
MKKYAGLISAVALVLVVIIAISASGLIDHARSLIKEEETTTATTVPTVGTTVGVVGTTPGATTTQPTTSDTTTPTLSPESNLPTQGADGSIPDTTLPPNNEEYTKEELEDLSVHELQNLLFSTTNPNTAGKILEIAGFEYDAEQCIYYSQMNPLQRKFGFNFVYDMAAPMVGMLYDTKRIEFEYGGKEWMVQLWKGQYGATAGAEIGLYSRDPDRAMQYDCANDEELITMQFDFYNMDEYVFSRGPEKHWWLTGFKVFHIGIPSFITMDMMLDFEDNYMANAFERALREVAAESLFDPVVYERQGSTFYIEW